MAKYEVTDTELTSVADAIRTKGGTYVALEFPAGFASAIGNIPTGTQPTLVTKSIIANGTYNASSDSADGYSSVSVAVAGTTRFVTGTFTPAVTEAESAKAITVPYSGSGYPISIVIYPTEGTYKSGTDIYASVQKKAIIFYAASKANTSEAPDYSTSGIEKNQVRSMMNYKNSDTDAANLSSSTSLSSIFTQNSASGNSVSSVVRFSSATTMSVFIASSNYGFLPGTEYTYEIVYSS